MGQIKNLLVYKKAFELAMEIFKITKRFPKEELYDLTLQIRKSSRSVCANLAEAYRRRKYPAHFTSKVTDSDTENTETDIWLEFSKACNYLTIEEFTNLSQKQIEVGRLIGDILKFPDKYR